MGGEEVPRVLHQQPHREKGEGYFSYSEKIWTRVFLWKDQLICDAEFCAVLMAAITCLTAVLFNVLSRISRFLCTVHDFKEASTSFQRKWIWRILRKLTSSMAFVALSSVFYYVEKFFPRKAPWWQMIMTWSYSPWGYVNKIVLLLQMQTWERWSRIQIHQESLQLVWKILRKQFSCIMRQHMKKGCIMMSSLIQREI